MPSEYKNLTQALNHIERIKEGTYPKVVQNGADFRIEERPWKEMPEPSKLVVLQDAVNWEGVTDRDMAHILLSEVDPGKITDAQRNRLIEAAAVNESYEETLETASRAGGKRVNEPDRER